MFTVIGLAIASLVSACLEYNPQDCRKFELAPFPSIGIENHMPIGNESNMPAALVKDFGGIWYMDGNPLGDECLTFADMLEDTTTTPVSYTKRVYDAGAFTWNNDLQGKLLYDAVRTNALTYRVTAPNSTVYHVEPEFFLPPYLLDVPLAISDYFAKFLIVRTEDPNLWLRPSSFFNVSVGSYNFVRIVYANGTRTPRYYSDYIPNINSNSSGITLSDTQLVPYVSSTSSW